MFAAQDSLASRAIPFMTLADGSKVKAPMPSELVAVERAALRFAVTGNAIVTGGSGALGLAGCRALLEHGLSGIALFDVNCAALEATVTSLQAEFPSAKVVGKTVDITDEDAVNGSVDAVAAELGPITTLVCFAGIVDCRHALETKASTWRRIIDVNMTGAFICAQAVAKQMVAAKTGGSIVFTASISAHRVNFPQPQAAYNVSKAAVVAMKNSLAAEWARYGIRVNTISPGYMDTILNEGAGLEEARNIWASRNPMGRMGFPSEIQGAVVLLASGAGSYINGTDILCDGGTIVF